MASLCWILPTTGEFSVRTDTIHRTTMTSPTDFPRASKLELRIKESFERGVHVVTTAPLRTRVEMALWKSTASPFICTRVALSSQLGGATPCQAEMWGEILIFT